jgi:hypothetical protein
MERGTVGHSWKKPVVEKLKMTVGLVLKDISIQHGPVDETQHLPRCHSNKIQANHGENDWSRYSNNIESLTIIAVDRINQLKMARK